MVPIIKIKASTQAIISDNFFDAIGLFFLTGCCLSFGASIISFIKYAPEEIAQKAINALNVTVKTPPDIIFPANIAGANKLKFLSHCLGRIVRII